MNFKSNLQLNNNKHIQEEDFDSTVEYALAYYEKYETSQAKYVVKQASKPPFFKLLKALYAPINKDHHILDLFRNPVIDFSPKQTADEKQSSILDSGEPRSQNLTMSSGTNRHLAEGFKKGLMVTPQTFHHYKIQRTIVPLFYPLREGLYQEAQKPHIFLRPLTVTQPLDTRHSVWNTLHTLWQGDSSLNYNHLQMDYRYKQAHSEMYSRSGTANIGIIFR